MVPSENPKRFVDASAAGDAREERLVAAQLAHQPPLTLLRVVVATNSEISTNAISCGISKSGMSACSQAVTRSVGVCVPDSCSPYPIATAPAPETSSTNRRESEPRCRH